MTSPEGLTPETSVPDLLTPRFDVEFEYFWERLSAGMEDLVSRRDLARLKRQALQKEIEFHDTVFQAVDAAAAAAAGPVICLFDVDGTLGEIKDDFSSQLHTLLRPSATPLISELAVRYPERLRFGLLSLRPQESLDAEMENPAFLAPIRPFLDEALVFSTETETRGDPLIVGSYDESYLKRFLATLQGTVDPELLARTLTGETDAFEWYDPKIRMLHQFLRLNPEATLILVDDLPCAAAFDPANSRLHGVWVGRQQQLLIPNGRH